MLDAQNTRFNVQALGRDGAMAKLYAQYRVLAASNRLIEALGVQMPTEAVMNQRAQVRVNPIPPEDRQENSFPYPVMGPPRRTGGRHQRRSSRSGPADGR